jgi:hypothetical protein
MDLFYRWGRLDPSTRTLVLDAGFILGTLVVALASFFIIRAATGGDEPRQSSVLGAIATPTVAATEASRGVSTEITPVPTSTPTPEPTTEATAEATPGKAPLEIDGALGRTEAYICEAGVSTSQDDSKRRAVRSWNQITAIWNSVVESEGRLNSAIPSPFTLENAAASDTYLAEARRHESVVLAAIDDLVALRASGIHTETREMSLLQGNFFDLERLTIQQTIQGVANNDAEEWNASVLLEGQRNSYLESARAKMRAVCEFIKQP